jgi:predicted alpha/beta-hydrolase family hydrolase
MPPKSRQRRLRYEDVSVVARVPGGWDGETAVILAHGAGQGMDSPFMSFFHEGLADLGHVSVKFNFHYMEAGRRAPDHQKKLRATYAGVIALVLAEFAPRMLVVGGKSMGGRVSSYIAGEVPEIGGLIFLGYPLHPPGKPDRLRDEHLCTLEKPMLFVSGTRDSLARKELLESVVTRIGPRATLHWIEGGDHSFRAGKRGPDHLPDALAKVDTWISGLSK